MKRAMSSQRGSFLLEALVAILIVALGVLGSVGLLARSMQDMDDARNRGEAAYLANQYISQMWVSDRLTANLATNYSSNPGTGANYLDFKNFVEQRLPNADQFPQDVLVAPGPNGAAAPGSSIVTITIRWCPPSDWIGGVCRGVGIAQPHKYDILAAIGAN
jgi:type IV pilus assembly protein PilV